MIRLAWSWLAEWVAVRAGRIGCRLLDRHHYAACRGWDDHQAVDGEIRRVDRVASDAAGRWVPARRWQSSRR